MNENPKQPSAQPPAGQPEQPRGDATDKPPSKPEMEVSPFEPAETDEFFGSQMPTDTRFVLDDE